MLTMFQNFTWSSKKLNVRLHFSSEWAFKVGVLKTFCSRVHIKNFPEISEVHFSALLALTGAYRSPLAVQILDHSPHFEYSCFKGQVTSSASHLKIEGELKSFHEI